MDVRQALTSYLFAYAAVLSLALGALAHLLVSHLTDARWFRRFRESAVAIVSIIPMLALLGIPILVFAPSIYSWATPELLPADVRIVVARKQAWLNVPFFVARGVVYLAVWAIIAERMRQLSLRKNEANSELHQRQVRVTCIIGIVALTLTLTFASFDWLMSLDPTWQSTVYGVYVLAGGTLASLGALALLSRNDQRARRRVPSDATPDDREDAETDDGAMGKLLLSFAAFWGYIAFSQYFIIWMADLPGEVTWYVVRAQQAWGAVGLVVALGQFLLPILLLLPRAAKRNQMLLALLGVWLMAMHVMDVYWLVMPALHVDGPQPHVFDAVWLGVIAIIVGIVMKWRAVRVA